eukprot:gene13392-20616_t
MGRAWLVAAAATLAAGLAADAGEFVAIDGFRDYEHFAGEGEPAEAGAPLSLTVVCERSGAAAVAAAARAVSDPGGASYGRYWTLGEAAEAMRPSAACVASVEAWAGPAAARLPDGSSWRLALPARAAERLFRTQFARFAAGPAAAAPFHRATTPVTVPRCVTGVLGAHGLPPHLFKQAPRRRPAASLQDASVDPSFLQQFYSVTGQPAGLANQSRALVEIGGAQIDQADVTRFFSQLVPTSKPGDDVVARYQGLPYVPGNGSISQSEIEYLMGVAPGVATEMWLYPSDGGFCSSLLAWLADANNASKSGNVSVFALTGGWQGDPSLVGCTAALMERVDEDLSKLASRGITVVAASGDDGSGAQVSGCAAGSSGYWDGSATTVTIGSTAYACCQLCATNAVCTHWTMNTSYSNDSTPSVECMLFEGNVTEKAAPAGVPWFPVSGKAPAMAMYAAWPATSEFVTAVGATSIEGSSEVASSSFGSGGGFAPKELNATRPQWQVSAVRTYFSLGFPLPPQGTYPALTRGIPDLALAGNNYLFVSDSTTLSTSGTAVAAAVFASMVSFLNDLRLQRGKPVLGFLNPSLYNHTSAFTDITLGDNRRDSFGNLLPIGWLAAPGWDPAGR